MIKSSRGVRSNGNSYSNGNKKKSVVCKIKRGIRSSSYQKLKVRISELIDKYEIKYLIFNFEKVNFMDSSGIGFIIGRYTQIKKHNGKVYVCSMNQLVERIFMLSGLKKICEVGKTEEDVERMMGVTA